MLEDQAKTHKELNEAAEKTKAKSSKQIEELDNKISLLEKSISELTINNEKLTEQYQEANSIINDHQKEVTQLKEKCEEANNKALEIQKRVEANKQKQENEYEKARDTIKYLRDENLDLNTKLDQQVTELEDQLREYRLRFEYAQKQLNSN